MAALSLLVLGAAAQDAATAEGEQAGFDLAAVRSSLAAMEADPALDAKIKDLLRPKFTLAIQRGEQAAANAVSANSFRDLVEHGAEQVKDTEAALAALPAPSAIEVDFSDASVQDLQARMEAQRLEVSKLKGELEKESGELASVERRPEAIINRLPLAQQELKDAQTALLEAKGRVAEPTTAGELAERALLEASLADLETEIGMLGDEQACQQVRSGLIRSQISLLERRLEIAEVSLELIGVEVNRRLKVEAETAVSEAEQISDLPLGEGGGGTLIEELQSLAKQFAETVDEILEVSADQKILTATTESLTNQSELLRGQLELGDSGQAMAQALVGLRLDLPEDWSISQASSRLRDQLTGARLAAIRIDDLVMKQREIERSFAQPVSPAIADLLKRRAESLAELDAQQTTLIRARSVLLQSHYDYQDKVGEVREMLDKSLFWMRSSPPLGAQSFKDLPEGTARLLKGGALGQLWESLTNQLGGNPALCALAILILLSLVVVRRRLRRSLSENAINIRRISTDRYSYTSSAVVATILLTLPIPLLIGFAGWLLWSDPFQNPWQTIGTTLLFIASISLPFFFVVEMCRRDGLGAAHFHWPEDTLTRIRRWCRLFLVIYPPALVVAGISFFCEEAKYFASLGRLAFLVAHLGIALMLWRLLRPETGAFAGFYRGRPDHFLTRYRKLWTAVAIGVPVVLALLAATGYFITAISLSLEVVLTAIIAMAGVISYNLALRWFMIRERKIALAEALQARQTRREAAAAEEQDGTAAPEASATSDFVTIEIDENALDLESIGVQTRKLLGFIFATATVFAIGVLWSKTIPSLGYFESARPILGLSLMQVLRLALIALITLIAVRNVPGLLELAVLRRTSMAVGTRHAVATLCQYALIAIGLGAIFQVLQVDWSKFGWIAAALSVGLGFGLQEVVANFVCGLILLFERPIRVGDVVTLEGITGKVTRIQIRATSITDWDQKEFVVPNKNVITGTLLNWTLSNQINRLIVTVGVAYGTDTELARRILLEIAAEHPLILNDPAPTASFEEFAASSLTLRLRVFLPDPENRIRTTTELHDEIAKRYAAAGIEIAFPQQDIHLRSGWPEVGAGSEYGGSGAAGESESGSGLPTGAG